MSISNRHLSDVALCEKAVARYRGGATKGQICRELGITPATVQRIIELHLPGAEADAIKRKNYRTPKLGEKNPRFGLLPTNYVGLCDDQKGYFTKVQDHKRYFHHRLVFAEMLGIPIEKLPPSMVVHHLDENPKNNSRDNLALLTAAGHRLIHAQLRRCKKNASLRARSSRPQGAATAILKRTRGWRAKSDRSSGSPAK